MCPTEKQQPSRSTARPKPATASEEFLLLSEPPSTFPIVDTHTHLALTHDAYLRHYKDGKYKDIRDFVKKIYEGRNVGAIVDVWMEAPVLKRWRNFADGALTAESRDRNFGGMQYWFAMGVHPHNAKFYTDEVEQEIIEAMSHPRCVSWGEMGLDYYYESSPRAVQQEVFVRQLRHAVRLGKPLTIHSRDANADTERILKAEVPADHKIHIHCFTNAPGFGQRLLDHFPNLYIGITGQYSYSMAAQSPQQPLRIVLETDAPYMIPANIYESQKLKSAKGRVPLCHTAMLPWTAAFVAHAAGPGWTTERVMREARENARKLYGV
ncbi:hypothetical protein DXG01_003976 [Tephrocybe rancida]|nr:hypothetical protein DXG01_003976 [Tephrocybe rancida]